MGAPDSPGSGAQTGAYWGIRTRFADLGLADDPLAHGGWTAQALDFLRQKAGTMRYLEPGDGPLGHRQVDGAGRGEVT